VRAALAEYLTSVGDPRGVGYYALVCIKIWDVASWSRQLRGGYVGRWVVVHPQDAWVLFRGEQWSEGPSWFDGLKNQVSRANGPIGRSTVGLWRDYPDRRAAENDAAEAFAALPAEAQALVYCAAISEFTC
jgi:hypothetical protein